MIVRIVKMTFEPEKIEEFWTLFEQVKHKIASFEGVLHLEALQDKNNPHIIFTYSHWEDEKYLEKYRHSELFAHTWKDTKALFKEKAEAWTTGLRFASK